MSMREAFSVGLKYFLVGFAIFFALWGGRPRGFSGASYDVHEELPSRISGRK